MKKFTKTYKNFHDKDYYNFVKNKQGYRDMECDKLLTLMYLGYFDNEDEKEGVVLNYEDEK